MPSSSLYGRVTLVRTGVSEEHIASIISVGRIGNVIQLLVTANVVRSSPILVTLNMEARSFETSVITRAIKRSIPEDGFPQSHNRENIKPCIENETLALPLMRHIEACLRKVSRLLVRADVPSSPIHVTLMMEALISSETLVLTRATRRNFPEYAILHSHNLGNFKSYIAFTGWIL
jgi:hypothetical protein